MKSGGPVDKETNAETGVLRIRLEKASGLLAADSNGSSDPFGIVGGMDGGGGGLVATDACASVMTSGLQRRLWVGRCLVGDRDRRLSSRKEV